MMNLTNRSSAMLSVIQRRFFRKSTRPWQDRLKPELERFRSRRLDMSFRVEGKPDQYLRPHYEDKVVIKQTERKLPSLAESRLPYQEYSEEERKRVGNFGTWYDPNFNPHLYDEKYRVDPNEEPFKAIYADSEETADTDQYTKVRNITTPELWSHVERLARIKVRPEVKRRKPNEPIEALPSGWVPPPEVPPELPYFIARTRNHLLPVYYNLHSDPEECKTIVKKITGDLWKLEQDLRGHLEELLGNNRRILTSVQETDGLIEFRGRHLHQVVDWLHQQGF